MVRLLSLIFTLFLLLPGSAAGISLDAAKEAIIEEGLASYGGACPCPYSHARNGSRCGSRSAYSKPGGAQPLCYPADITDGMVANYLRRTGQKLDKPPTK